MLLLVVVVAVGGLLLLMVLPSGVQAAEPTIAALMGAVAVEPQEGPGLALLASAAAG